MQHDRGALLTGIGMGAGLMYFFDPARGRRRRALVRDKVTRAGRLGREAAGTTSRDVNHRVAGAGARLRRALRRTRVPDDVLAERVRARLGHVVSHPHALDVDARDGVVTLSGPILQAEVNRLLNSAARVRGVGEIVSRLEEHAEPDVPALQSHAHVTRRRFPFVRSPFERLLTVTTGLLLTRYGAARRDATGWVVTATGIGLLAAAGTGPLRRRLFRIGGGSRSSAAPGSSLSGVGSLSDAAQNLRDAQDGDGVTG